MHRLTVMWVEDGRLNQLHDPKQRLGSIAFYPLREKAHFLRLNPSGEVATWVEESDGMRVWKGWRRCGWWVKHDAGVTALITLQKNTEEPEIGKHEG